jgi:hypothetical protein
VNKKKQKNLMTLAPAVETSGAHLTKVFCALFYKKALLHLIGAIKGNAP